MVVPLAANSVNIAVCGKFHLFNYIPFLRAAGYLNRFYYSHSRQVETELYSRYIRMPVKEYLIQGHSRVLGDFMLDAMNPVYADIWRRSVLARWTKSAIFQFVVLGHSLPLARRAKKEGAFVIADVVSTHPEHRRRQLMEEAQKWQLPNRYAQIPRYERFVDGEIESADLILAPSHHVAKTYTDRFPGVPAAVIPYATNVARFFPPSIPRRVDGPLRIVTVGTVGLRKGQLYLLEAISKVPRGSIELTLVGAIDPPIKKHLVKYRHLFTHIPRVPNDELVQLHHRHDLFMLNSVEEGLAVSICEAMGSGMPVACTAETGANEIVDDKVDGYILPSRSVEGIEQFLAFAIRNRQELLAVGSRAAEKAAKFGNWQIYADRLMTVYEKVLVTGGRL